MSGKYGVGDIVDLTVRAKVTEVVHYPSIREHGYRVQFLSSDVDVDGRSLGTRSGYFADDARQALVERAKKPIGVGVVIRRDELHRLDDAPPGTVVRGTVSRDYLVRRAGGGSRWDGPHGLLGDFTVVYIPEAD